MSPSLIDESALLAGHGEVELVGQRTRTGKTFQVGDPRDDVRRLVSAIGPVHYRADPFDPREAWKEIDLTVEADPAWECDCALTRNGYQAQFWSEHGAEQCVAQFVRGGDWIDMWPQALAWVNDAGESQPIAKPAPAGPPEIDNDAHTVTWPNALGPGIDYGYRVWPDHLYKIVTVRTAEALPKPTIDSKGLRLRVTIGVRWFGGVEPAKALDAPGGVSFRQTDGRPLWRLNRARAWHAGDAQQAIRPTTIADRTGESESLLYVDTPVEDLKADGVAYPLQIDASISEQVPSGADDGDLWWNTTTFYNDNASVIMGYHPGPGNEVDAWVRFTAVALPHGATVSAAKFTRIFAKESRSGTCRIRIYGQLEADANQIDSAAQLINAPLTTASTGVTVASWIAEAWYELTVDASCIQELIDQTGWYSGQAMAFSLQNESPRSTDYRAFYSYVGDSAKAAMLSVTYSGGSEGTQVSVQVADGSDDGDYLAPPSETWNGSGTTLNLGSPAGGVNFDLWAKFPATGIPQGSVIDYAKVRVCSYGDHVAAGLAVDTHCQDEDDAADITSTGDYSGTDWTTAKHAVAYTNTYDDLWYDFEVTDALQEVVDRGGFAEAAVGVALQQDDGGHVVAFSYEGDSAKGPKLFVVYSSPPAAASPQDLTILTAIDAPTVAQQHEVSPEDLAVVVAFDAPGLVRVYVVSPEDLAVLTAIDAPTVVRHYAVGPQDLAVAVVFDSPALVGAHVLSPAGLVVLTALDAPRVPQNHVVSPDEMAIATAFGAPWALREIPLHLYLEGDVVRLVTEEDAWLAVDGEVHAEIGPANVIGGDALDPRMYLFAYDAPLAALAFLATPFDRVGLAWTGQAFRFVISRRPSGGDWAVLATVTDNEYSDGPLADGDYGYKVEAEDEEGDGAESGEVEVSVSSAPEPPSGIAYEFDSETGTLTVTWDASTSADVATYRVRSSAGEPVLLLDSAPVQDSASLSYEQVFTTETGVWIFSVRAVDSDGKEEANVSQVVAVAFASGSLTAFPASPRILLAEASAGGKVTLAWLYEPADESGGPGAAFEARVYYDNATGTVDYSTPLDTVVMGSPTEVDWHEWESDALVDEQEYRFAVRVATAAHPAGIEDPNTHEVTVTPDSDSPDAPVLTAEVV